MGWIAGVNLLTFLHPQPFTSDLSVSRMGGESKHMSSQTPSLILGGPKSPAAAVLARRFARFSALNLPRKTDIMRTSTPSRSEAQANSKASGTTSDHPVFGDGLAPWNFLSEFSRQQLAMITEGTSAIFRGDEALRKIQQEAAHDASVRHAKAAQRLFSPCQPADMLSIQSELLRTDMQSAGHYWQQLAATTMQTQREMMSSITHLLDNESGNGMSMKSAMEAFQAAIPAMAVPNDFFTPKAKSMHE